MAVEELDRNLRQFYAEARNKEGENYSRATLLSLRNGIERYLNTPPHSLGIRFTHDPRFVLSNQMLDAKIKQLKQEGMQNTKHKPEKEDLAKLKTSEVFSLTKPFGFMFLCFGVVVGLKARETSRKQALRLREMQQAALSSP